MPHVPRRTQADRSAQTRSALIAAARPLFGTVGYAAVALEGVVAAAGVTRGALYHHFADKRELFLAVFEQVESEVIDQLGEVLQLTSDVAGDIDAAISSYLDICSDPQVRRISLVDAPAVLGWQQWRDVEAEFSLGLLVTRLELAVRDGITLPAPIPVVASLILSAAMETGLIVATADDPELARTQAHTALRAMLHGLVGLPVTQPGAATGSVSRNTAPPAGG